MSSRIAVVVLNYKGIEDTLACVNSLQQQTLRDFHLILVENGSHDGSDKKLRELESDRVTVICNARNLGFAGGVNTGIRWAMANSFDSVALFNNDAVADPKWIESLVTAQKEHKAGITTALLLHEDGKTIDSTGEWYSKWGLPFPRNRGEKTSDAPDEGFVFGATGGSSLYSLKMLGEIGLFDEAFFAYYEDIDISFRAQLAGYKVMFTPKAIAYHKQGATSSKMPGFTIYQTFKNLPLLYLKNVPRGLVLSVGVRLWFAYIMMLGNAVAKGSGWCALKGWAWGIFLIPRALLQRIVIQHNKKVSTPYIRSVIWDDLPPKQTGLQKIRRVFHVK